MPLKPLVAIVGPTGVGKSSLALALAQKFNGEIINADSRQVYRYMDIGTAKPSPSEMASVPHHLFSYLDPDQDFSLAQYQASAAVLIQQIQARNHLPLLVGGSGQYLWALLEGWVIPGVPPDLEYRRKLEQMAAASGSEELYQQLLQLDPEGAQMIDRRNLRRVIRALEVSHQSGIPFSQQKRKIPPDFQTLIIGLTSDRDELYRRLDLRVENMLQAGLVAEVAALVRSGFNLDLSALNSIGYRQIGQALQNQITLAEAVQKIKNDTHRFVRHQYAWFRLEDHRIHWFDTRGDISYEVLTLVNDFLQS